MNRNTRVAKMTAIPILPTMNSLTSLPRDGIPTCLTLRGKLTILTSAISMGRLTRKDRHGGLYRLTATATRTRLTRMITPTSQHMRIRG